METGCRERQAGKGETADRANIDLNAYGGLEALSGALLVEIQRQYCYLKTKLFELYERGLGINRNLDSRRSKLEIQLDKLNEEARGERVRAWQDVENLSREWRTWFKQYCDLVQRLRIILPEQTLKRSGTRLSERFQ